jgi:hypothetical protein
MERNMRLLLAAAVGVVFGVGLGFSAPVVGALAVQAWPAAGGQVPQWVDRTHKGDRLQVPTTRVGKQPAKAPRILIGCEPAASPLAASTASIPGRCTA